MWGFITPICPGTGSSPMSRTCRTRKPGGDGRPPDDASYVLASDIAAHYDGVIRKMQARGIWP
jgi:hypothetical protein